VLFVVVADVEVCVEVDDGAGAVSSL